MSTRIVMVRHGESNNNVSRTIAGVKACTGLTAHGIEQAEHLRDRLAAEAFMVDEVICSTMERAIQTANIVADAVGHLPVQLADLGEINPGECEGESWVDWGPHFLRMLHEDKDLVMSPGGESINEFHDRAAAVLLKIADEYEGQTVLVVTHGGIILGSISRLINEDPEFEPENTSLTEWTIENGRWQLVRFNDHSHLA